MAKRSTNTKERILDATKTLFSIHGAERTTIDDIITSSGITKGAFYHYFKSKESLCQTVIEQAMLDYQLLVDSLDETLTPLEQLRQVITKLALLNTSGEWVNCRLIISLSSESHNSSPKIQQMLKDFWLWYSDFYQELLTRCREAGQIGTSFEVKNQTKILISLLAGVIITENVDPNALTIADMAESIIKILQV